MQYVRQPPEGQVAHIPTLKRLVEGVMPDNAASGATCEYCVQWEGGVEYELLQDFDCARPSRQHAHAHAPNESCATPHARDIPFVITAHTRAHLCLICASVPVLPNSEAQTRSA